MIYESKTVSHTGVDGGPPEAWLEGPEDGGDALHLRLWQHLRMTCPATTLCMKEENYKIQPRNPFILYLNHFNLPRNSPKKRSHSGWLFSPPRLPLPIVANPHISVDGFLLHFKLLLHVGRHFVVVVLVLGGGWWSNCQTAVFDISTYQHEHGRI